MDAGLIVLFLLAVLVLFILAKTAVVVPQQSAYIVERLGRYSGTLNAGFHILIPFLDVIRYRHSLKEVAIDIAEQICITRDNVQVSVDGVLYLKVLNAERASYGITNFVFAISQLAQTTLRSEVGKIELDRTFEERTNINTAVVSELDKASDPWGVKVLRYEIKNIKPPRDVLDAMEKQMRAEREKRAVILNSEGIRDAAINEAEGRKQEVIKNSEAKRTQQINEAEGEAAAIRSVAGATAEGIVKVAEAIQSPGGVSSPPTAGGRAVHRRVRQAGQGRQQPHHAGVGERRGIHGGHGHEHHQAGRLRGPFVLQGQVSGTIASLSLFEINEKEFSTKSHEGSRRDTKRDSSAASTRLRPGNPARAPGGTSSHDLCWLVTDSMSSMSRWFIHIDAQDTQDSLQETASFQCRESAKSHRIIA